VTLISANFFIDTLEIDETISTEFTFSVSQETPEGTPLIFDYILSSGEYMVTSQYVPVAGLNVEDFESGGFESFWWEFGGNAPWDICLDGPYEGVYCSQSGNISHGQLSELKLGHNVLVNDTGLVTRQIERMILKSFPVNMDMTKTEIIEYKEDRITVYWRVFKSENQTTLSDVGSVSFVKKSDQTLVVFRSAHQLGLAGIELPNNWIIQKKIV